MMTTTATSPSISVRSLQSDLPFGARIAGVSMHTLQDEQVRTQILEVFEERGLIVFEDIEQTGEMQLALSKVFGPLKEFPMPSVQHADKNQLPGVIDMTYTPDNPGARQGMVEVDGKILHSWLPWHFDHCYNDKLNRGGVLRAVVIPAEGGLTRFSDGAVLYEQLPRNLRDQLENQNIIYSLRELPLEKIRFGRPNFRLHYRNADGHAGILKQAETTPRAIHPAVWRRADGRKVLHLCGHFACGIEGNETPAGDQLLDAACHEVNRLSDATSYVHAWQGTEMLIWDNWRMLHQAGGADPKYPRSMQRSTIMGDYGLGYFENNQTGHESLERSTM